MDERQKLRRLRVLFDFTVSVIYQTNNGVAYDFELVEKVRIAAEKMFPGSAKTFYLLYFSRFKRVLREKYGLKADFYEHPLNVKFEEYFGGTRNEKATIQ